tara:strand:- start:537 stop:914 length:378 start_codon:yes stop_codon:yes gene_type:complete
MLVKCTVCSADFKPRWIGTQHKKAICDDCNRNSQMSRSVKRLNMDTQNDIMSFNKRLDKIEQKIDMVETIAESVVTSEFSKMERNIEGNIREIVERIVGEVLEAKLEKFQNQIITLHNKIKENEI